MKIRIIYILIFLISCPIFGQMPENGDYSNWDWENQDQINWRTKQGNNWIDITPPFLAQSERVGEIVKIYESQDYTAAKGWQLVWAQFDGIYPYFILYNAHKGLVRAFFYLEAQPFTHLLATLSFYDINNPAILTYGNEYQIASDKYFNGSLTNNKDMISVVIPIVHPQTWCSADFPLVFDNNIQNSKYNSKKWVINFYGCENYAISIVGTSGPASLEQQTISGSKTDVTSTQFSANLAKLHKQLESNDKFMQEMQNSVKDINDASPDYLKAYKGIVKSLKPLSQIFTAAKGMSAGASAVLGFMKVVSGNFNEQNSTLPQATTQYLQLQGTMDIKFPLGGNTLKIPGVNGSYFPPVSWIPYDCPVGYFGLEKTPKIRKTTAYEKYKFHDADDLSMGASNGEIAYIYNLLNFPTLLAAGDHPPVSGYLGKFVKYKFEDNNVVSVNNIPGLTLVEINFAIVCKLTGIGSEKFDITDEYIPCKFWDGIGKEYHVPVVNPIYEALDLGFYKLYKYDKDNDGIYFGTPELPMNQLKDIVIEVPEKSEIMLRVIAKFTSDTYNDPIMFQANYMMDVQTENANKSKLYCYMEQTNFKWDYITDKLVIKLNTANSSEFRAHLVDMETGFVGTNGFVATSAPISYPTKGNTTINNYSFSCSFNAPGSFKSTLSSEPETMDLISQKGNLIIYPNPTNGSFSISSVELGDKIKEIRVVNSMGALVYFLDNINDETMKIELTNVPSGFYLIETTLCNNKKLLSKLIIK